MPELPEVETYRAFLDHHLQTRTILQSTIFVAKAARNQTVDSLNKKLQNQSIQMIARHGKYLAFHFRHGILLVHLRMEGRFQICRKKDLQTKHVIFNWKLDDQKWCQFLDHRKFATLDWIPNHDLTTHPLGQKIGPDPVTTHLTPAYLQAAWKHRRINVKTALLEQKVISGIGNIYACEILFVSKIAPQRQVASLKIAELTNLLKASRSILQTAIKVGGTTTKSFAVNHQKGNFVQQLQVYQRANLPCSNCQTLIRKVQLNQRGTYFCPTCQQ